MDGVGQAIDKMTLATETLKEKYFLWNKFFAISNCPKQDTFLLSGLNIRGCSCLWLQAGYAASSKVNHAFAYVFDCILFAAVMLTAGHLWIQCKNVHNTLNCSQELPAL